MDRISIYDRVTNQIITDLENGLMPYTKPWKDGVGRAGLAFPANATTEKTYSGINTLILWCAGSAMDYPTQRWLTFKQALDAGGCVRKGEKGETIVRASTFVPKDEKRNAREEDRDPASIPFLKAYTVFNVAQCDGLEADVVGVVAHEPETPAIELPVNEAADRMIAASGMTFIPQPDQAFYRPLDDVIAMPPMRAFHDPINCIGRRCTKPPMRRVPSTASTVCRNTRDLVHKHTREKSLSPRSPAAFSVPPTTSFRPFVTPTTSVTG